MYDYIFLDLDGTLTESGPGITRSVQYALKRFGITAEEKELECFIGPPLVESFQRFYHFSEEDAKTGVSLYREYFAERGIFENEVYPGVVDMCEALLKKGKKLVVATSKPEVYTLRILDHFDLAKYFTFVSGATMDEKRNQKAEIITYAIEQLGLTSEEDKKRILMVGDRHHDIQGAKENGIDAAGVLYGYGSREELEEAGAKYIVAEAMEVVGLV